jgi:hypothetical protein
MFVSFFVQIAFYNKLQFFAKKSEKVPKLFQVVAFGAATLSIMTLSMMALSATGRKA